MGIKYDNISALVFSRKSSRNSFFGGLEQKQIKIIECSTLFQRNVTGTQGAL